MLRAHFPGEEIAETITKKWHERFNQPLKIVGGSIWFAGNVNYYSTDRPSVYVGLDQKRAAWGSDEKVREHGAVILWDSSMQDENIFADLRARFPNVEIQQPIVANWQTSIKSTPFPQGWAIIPPSGK